MTETYVPAPIDEMMQAMGDMEKFIHLGIDVHVLARAAMIHYQFDALHPFLDGNGRAGRLLMAFLFIEWNVLHQPSLNLSVYFERYRQEYYDHLLAVSQRGAWDAWLRFFMRGSAPRCRIAWCACSDCKQFANNTNIWRNLTETRSVWAQCWTSCFSDRFFLQNNRRATWVCRSKLAGGILRNLPAPEFYTK